MTGGDVHAVPLDDVIDHPASADCVCTPQLEAVPRDDGSYGWLYIHRRIDPRQPSAPAVRKGGNAMNGNEVHLMKGKGLQPWFLRLVNRQNGEVLAVSEGYTRRWSAKRAARKNFPGIPFVDKSAKPYRKFGAGA